MGKVRLLKLQRKLCALEYLKVTVQHQIKLFKRSPYNQSGKLQKEFLICAEDQNLSF